MIRTFDNAVRVFFPTKWANSVSRWILGLNSPSGTIKIGNTPEPSEGSSATIDVDEERLLQRLIERLDSRYVAKSKIGECMDATTIAVKDGKVGVRQDFILEYLDRLGVPHG